MNHPVEQFVEAFRGLSVSKFAFTDQPALRRAAVDASKVARYLKNIAEKRGIEIDQVCLYICFL